MIVVISNYIIRPPGTVFPGGLRFTAEFIFSVLLQCHRAPSADRRETLPHNLKYVRFVIRMSDFGRFFFKEI